MSSSILKLAESQLDYLTRRYQEESDAAKLSTNDATRRVHCEMACRYALKIAELETQDFGRRNRQLAFECVPSEASSKQFTMIA
jgi:hypothetical protein